MTNTPLELEIRDERLRELIAADAGLTQVATGFVFTEGPVWEPTSASLVWSDIIGNAMYRWTAERGVSSYRQPSNMANGNTLDNDGRLLTCEHATSRVTRAEADGSTTVLATHYDGKELNSPNDIVVKSDGTVYFTDPPAGRTARYGIERPQELSVPGRLSPRSGNWRAHAPGR